VAGAHLGERAAPGSHSEVSSPRAGCGFAHFAAFLARSGLPSRLLVAMRNALGVEGLVVLVKRIPTVVASAAAMIVFGVAPASAESFDSARSFGATPVLENEATSLTKEVGSAHLPGDGFRVTEVRVLVEDATHTNPSDFDLAFSANGFTTMLMSDAGGEAAFLDTNIVNVDLLFDQDALPPPDDDPPPLAPGTFRPTDYDGGENDSGADGILALFHAGPSDPGLDILDGLEPESLRGPWSFIAADDADNGEVGDIVNVQALIRLDRPDVDTLVATPNTADQNVPANVTATATAFGPDCTIDAATGYEFDLNGDGDFADSSEGPGTNTRPLDTSTVGSRPVRVRVTQGGAGCAATGAFRVETLNFAVGAVPEVAMCGGLPATLQGTNAPDTIVGTAGADVIAGLGGGDVIVGLGGNDTVCGGDGSDLLKGGGDKDKLFGEAGSDVLKGGRARDVCIGGLGLDRAKKCEKSGSL
jgi:Ca2+-binding RTX toxin-like protein